MFVLPTHQCSQPPGRNRRWLALAVAISALIAPGVEDAGAQVSVGRAPSCPGGMSAGGDLGIDFDCQDCALSYSPSARAWRWRFRSEPVIKHVSSSGPSRSKLREGDVIVSIDGSLITTRSGGVKLAALEPDEPVTVTVRRSGRDHSVEITPSAACPTDAGVAVFAPAPTVSPPEPPVGPTAPRAPAAGVASVLAPLPPTLSGTRSWFGFGLSCSNCSFYPVRHEEIAAVVAQLEAQALAGESDRRYYRTLEALRSEGSRWEFSENPRVFSVDEGGPADKAGLRRGDILTHIDGLALVSDEGGKRLGQVKPGDLVEFIYRRGTKVGTASLTVGREPTVRGIASERARRSLALLERSLSRIERTEDQAVRAEIVQLQAQLRAAERAQRAESIQLLRQEGARTMPLRYSGVISDVNVTVRSHGSVVVSRDEETGEVVITTSDATIRVKPED